MDGRIGQLHCRILRARDGVLSPSVLERVARERLATALSAELDALAGDDAAVYVVRSVRAGLVLTGDAPSEAVLTGLWSRQLGAAVGRVLASADGDTVVRFADEAEFIACFAAELVAGRAWERWYFGAFAALRPLGTAEALRRVLRERRELLPATLAWCERHGTLEQVLAELDDATLRDLAEQAPELDAIEPLFTTALRLLERLGVLDSRRVDASALLARHLASGPSPVSWRDRRSLAVGALEAARCLARELDLAPVPEPPESAFAELDWLDAEWLRERLAEVLGGPPAPARPVPLSIRREGVTPAQRAVLAELGAVLVEVRLDLDALDSPANVLRLSAALAVRGRFDADVVSGVLVRVLRAAARARARTQGAPANRCAHEPGDAELLAELGPAATVLIGGPRAALDPGALVASPGAGALLALRGALDLRLPALCARWSYPAGGFPALALALCRQWSGCDVDPAFSLLTGLREAPPLEPPPEGFEPELAETLRRQGIEAVEPIAFAVLRAWARWLPGFADAGTPYLLEHFVRRPGAVACHEGELLVVLQPRPLDVVLEMAGYLEPLDATRSLDRRLTFRSSDA